MKKLNTIKYIFIVIICFLFLCPCGVYAEELVKCKYEADGGTTVFNFTLSKSGNDYSARGSLKMFENTSQGQHPDIKNFNDWIGTFSKKPIKEMCPSYVVIYKVHTYTTTIGVLFPTEDSTSWEVEAYDNEADAESALAKRKNSTDYDGLTGTTTAIEIQSKVLHSTNNSSYAKKHGYSSDGFSIDIGKEIATKNCEDVLGESVVEFLQMIFNYIKILGPVLVILFSSVDFTKSILSSDEENMKKTQKRFGIRLGCAIGLYFLPLIATFIINLVFGTSGSQICGLK